MEPEEEQERVVFDYTVEAKEATFNVYTTHDRRDGPLYVKELTMTCGACPAQWDATLDDGRELYIRYRWGGLSVRFGVGGEELLAASKQNDGWDGVLSQEELQRIVFDVLHLPDEY